jgi:hypothetical protein
MVRNAGSDLDEEGVEAAADALYKVGLHHHWWRGPPKLAASWHDLDPIGRNEFCGIVEGVIKAYLQATADEFRLIFPRQGQDLEVSETVFKRLGRQRAVELFTPIWTRPILKENVQGIHGPLFYNYFDKRHHLPASKREVDRTESQINQSQRELYRAARDKLPKRRGTG